MSRLIMLQPSFYVHSVTLHVCVCVCVCVCDFFNYIYLLSVNVLKPGMPSSVLVPEVTTHPSGCHPQVRRNETP